MAAIEASTRTVYYAPTKGRRYLTKISAARNEASAMLSLKYPAEDGDESDGYYSWHWSDDERLVRVHKRLARLLMKHMRGTND